MRSIIRILLIVFIIAINVGCDQVSKLVVRENIAYREHQYYLNDILLLTNVENKGAFLSWGSDMPEAWRQIILLVMPIIALIGILVYLIRTYSFSNTMTLGMSCIIGGGIGNMYDRYIYGSVTDFLYIDLGIFHTGIFNLADVSIMMGGALILFHYLPIKKLQIKKDS